MRCVRHYNCYQELVVATWHVSSAVTSLISMQGYMAIRIGACQLATGFLMASCRPTDCNTVWIKRTNWPASICAPFSSRDVLC